MKTKALITTSRALLGREGTGLLYHFKFIESFFDEYHLLSNNKSPATKKTVNDKIGLPMKNVFVDLFKETLSMKNWLNVYDWLDVSSYKDYDALFIMGGLDIPSNKISKAYLPKDNEKLFPNTNNAIKFKQTATPFTKILLMLKIHNEYKIPLYELAFDPIELSCDYFHESVVPTGEYHSFYGYAVPRYNLKRLDSLQYYFLNKNELPLDFDNEKKFDFTFGYHIMKNSSRNKFNNDIEEICGVFDEKKRNIFCNNKITEIDTSVPKEVYFNYIKASKYTYILPAYDETCFSVYRFIESLANDCLPLLHGDCQIDEINASFNTDLSVLKRKTPFSENDRKDILEHFKDIFFGNLVLI